MFLLCFTKILNKAFLHDSQVSLQSWSLWPTVRLSSLLLGESNRLSISDSEVEGAENGMREKLHCTL